MKKTILFFVMFLAASSSHSDELRTRVEANGTTTYTNSGPTVREQEQRQQKAQINALKAERDSLKAERDSLIQFNQQDNQKSKHQKEEEEYSNKIATEERYLQSKMKHGNRVSMQKRLRLLQSDPDLYFRKYPPTMQVVVQ